MADSPPSTKVVTKPAANLPAVVKPQAAKKISELKKSQNELTKLETDQPDQIIKYAGLMDLLRSSVLAGFLGGTVGTTAGITFGGLAIAGFSLPAIAITGPLGMTAGIALALLAWRGPSQWRLEKRLSNMKPLLSSIDDRIEASNKQIGALPANAPEHVREAMWRAHVALIEQRSEIESSHREDVSALQ